MQYREKTPVAWLADAKWNTQYILTTTQILITPAIAAAKVQNQIEVDYPLLARLSLANSLAKSWNITQMVQNLCSFIHIHFMIPNIPCKTIESNHPVSFNYTLAWDGKYNALDIRLFGSNSDTIVIKNYLHSCDTGIVLFQRENSG